MTEEDIELACPANLPWVLVLTVSSTGLGEEPCLTLLPAFFCQNGKRSGIKVGTKTALSSGLVSILQPWFDFHLSILDLLRVVGSTLNSIESRYVRRCSHG